VRRSSSATTRPALGAALLTVLFASLLAGAPLHAEGLDVKAPGVLLSGVPFRLEITAPGALETVVVSVQTASGREIGTAEIPPFGTAAFDEVVVASASELPIRITSAAGEAAVHPHVIPGWLTILPPLLAIVLALLTHEVVTSLFAGIWLGCIFLAGWNPLAALLMAIDRFVRGALSNQDHAAIIIFSLLLGGMVGVLNKMGASRAIVEAVSPLATSRRRAQFAAWAAGIAIFFDDYANTLIVGNTMRPLTDRLKVSREKLAYIVDSTAAPVAALAFVSTWVGFEVGLIGSSLDRADQHAGITPGVSAFGLFFHSIPYLFYPILALLFVLTLIVMRRDFGPMLAAERRAFSGRGLFDPKAQPSSEWDEAADLPEGGSARWWMGALPVGVVVGTVLIGLYRTGKAALPAGSDGSLMDIFGNADPYVPLLWGSLLGCMVAIALAVGGRMLSLDVAMKAWLGGLRSMLMAICILVLAWSLGDITESLGAAGSLSSMLSDKLPPFLLPVSVFTVAAAISFATGTSWATMAILYPLVMPLAFALGALPDPNADGPYHLLQGAVAAVMAGSLFGDHCSPISDTTVMSSMASGCDHVDHVKTQLPYALATAAIVIVVSIPAGLGFSPWLCMGTGAAAVIAVVRFVGRPVEVA